MNSPKVVKLSFYSVCLTVLMMPCLAFSHSSCPSQVSTAIQLHGVLNNFACSGKTVVLMKGTYSPVLPPAATLVIVPLMSL